MRSWSKWVIFSRRMKSSIAVGPRRPIFSESWLFPTGTPWLVVSTRPLSSTRTRSSGPFKGFLPISGVPSPTLGEAMSSVVVLAVASGVDGAWRVPSCGGKASSPYSRGLVGLNGISAARAMSDTTFSSRRSLSGVLAPRLVGGLASAGRATVLRMEPAPSSAPFFLRVAMDYLID